MKMDNKKEAPKTSIITVVGNSRIEDEADMLELKIIITKTSDTLKQSWTEIKRITESVMNILKTKNINRKNIHITSVELKPNHSFSTNNTECTGQKVEQNILCIIDNNSMDIEKLIEILDSLTGNNNSISLDFNFAIRENRDMILKCREFAFQDGLEKAKRYAKLAGLKITRVNKISEYEPSTYKGRPDLEACFYEQDLGNPEELIIKKVEKIMQLYIEFSAE